MITSNELRAFEEDIKEEFLAGSIRAPIHLSGGNEEQLISIFRDVIPNDWVFSTHRSHYHALLKGVPPELVKHEIMAGRSMHLNFKEYKFFTSSIVAGCCPIAVGVAMAIKRRGGNEKVWVFVGDMAAKAGIFRESCEYAGRNTLPITFVVEDNEFSTNTPTDKAWGDYRWYYNMDTGYTYKRIYPHINAGKWVDFK